MFKVSRTSPKFLKHLRDALVDELEKAGIRDVAVKTEPVRATRLHRVLVEAGGFKHLRPSERQDLVWRIADSVLQADERFRISIILTLTPEELQGA
jgi:hypothetical protein